MLFIKKEIWIAVYVSISAASLQAQQAIVTAGGNSANNSGSVSYSVGQTVYTYLVGTNGSVYQGVQLPYEISTVMSTSTAIKEVVGITLNCIAYPNPVADVLTLAVDDNAFFINSRVTLQIIDMSGKILDEQVIADPQTNISMINYTPGLYFLQVEQNNNVIKTFKIIKH
jgi:hypothetical protein